MDSILNKKLEELLKKSESFEVSTKFLTLAECSEVYDFANKHYVRNYKLFPEEGERKIAHFYPDYITENFDFPVRLLKIESPLKLGHREILGSLMSLGIKREFLGDIILDDKCAYVYAISSMSDYILQNLTKVSRQNVSLSTVDFSEISKISNEFCIIKDTVKSLRLDGIIASGFKMSRNEALNYIKSAKVYVNGREIIKPDYKILENDKISVKGKGKMELFIIGGTSKKERIFIEIKKFI